MVTSGVTEQESSVFNLCVQFAFLLSVRETCRSVIVKLLTVEEEVLYNYC